MPIVEGVSRATGSQTGAAHFSVSETGSLIYIPVPLDASAGLGETMQLGLIDRKGVIERFTPPAGCVSDASCVSRRHPHRLRDRRWQGGDRLDLSTCLGKAPRRRLTFGGNNRFPIWSADGKRIVFQSDRDGDAALFWQPADGSGTAERLTTPMNRHIARS